jgi:hypothetical protein
MSISISSVHHALLCALLVLSGDRPSALADPSPMEAHATRTRGSRVLLPRQNLSMGAGIYYLKATQHIGTGYSPHVGLLNGLLNGLHNGHDLQEIDSALRRCSRSTFVAPPDSG